MKDSLRLSKWQGSKLCFRRLLSRQLRWSADPLVCWSADPLAGRAAGGSWVGRLTATKRATGSRPVPKVWRLPRKPKVDVSKCHASHAKCRSAPGDQRRPSAPPDPAQCHKCHACHAKRRSMWVRDKVASERLKTICDWHSCVWKIVRDKDVCDKVVCVWQRCVRQSCVWQSSVWSLCVTKLCVCERLCDKVVCARLCVTKLCVCDKDVCDKVACERLCACGKVVCVWQKCL